MIFHLISFWFILFQVHYHLPKRLFINPVIEHDPGFIQSLPDLFQFWLTPLLEVKHDPVFIQPLTRFSPCTTPMPVIKRDPVFIQPLTPFSPCTTPMPVIKHDPVFIQPLFQSLHHPTAWSQTCPCLYTAPDLFQSLYHPTAWGQTWPSLYSPWPVSVLAPPHCLGSNMTLSLYNPWPVSVLAPPHFLARCEHWRCRPSRWFCTDPLHTATTLCVQCRQTSCHTQQQKLNKICKISIIFLNIPSLIKRKKCMQTCLCIPPSSQHSIVTHSVTDSVLWRRHVKNTQTCNAHQNTHTHLLLNTNTKTKVSFFYIYIFFIHSCCWGVFVVDGFFVVFLNSFF